MRIWLRRTLLSLLICTAGIVLTCAVLWSRAVFLRSKSGCPMLAWLLPLPHKQVVPSDYIELEADGGLTPWEPVTVKIYGDGRVERDTTRRGHDGWISGCPLHPADNHIQIPAQAAKDLLQRAQAGGFCRLCDAYTFPGEIMDAGSSEVTLSIGGQVKSTWNHAGTPPQLYNELETTIWHLSSLIVFVDTRQYSPERKAECSRFSDEQQKLHPVM